MRAFVRKKTNMSGEAVIALAGNPNVGKSTVFNALTGMHQHTGNWPGKTVAVADGGFTYNHKSYKIIDLPGTYSLAARSEEEAVARDFLEQGQYDAVVVVADATCLERNLNLALQIREITGRMILCVNLCDEAKRKKICIDAHKLSELLGNIPVVMTSAVNKKGFEKLLSAMEKISEKSGDNSFEILTEDERKNKSYADIKAYKTAVMCKEIAKRTVVKCDNGCNERDRRIDKILTGKFTGIPFLLLFFAAIFYITAVGANFPSSWLFDKLFALEPVLYDAMAFLPQGARLALSEGVYRTVAWIVSVMLPPMAIFFPLFTLLEDLGYLPRIAFNLDSAFCRCGTCGKQALTMW